MTECCAGYEDGLSAGARAGFSQSPEQSSVSTINSSEAPHALAGTCC